MPAIGFQVGDVIRKLRKKERWNIADLATRSTVNKATISAIERGGNFQRDTLEKIARAFGMSSADALLRETTTAAPDNLRAKLLALWDAISPEFQPAALGAVERVAALSERIQQLTVQVHATAQRDVDDDRRDRSDVAHLQTLEAEVRRLGVAAGKRSPAAARKRRTG